jgi:hypothetical protein
LVSFGYTRGKFYRKCGYDQDIPAKPFVACPDKIAMNFFGGKAHCE